MIRFFNLLVSPNDRNFRSIAFSSLKSLCVKLLATLVGLLISIAISRLIGASGIGMISLASKIVITLIAICLFGFAPYLVKNIAILKSEFNYSRIASVLYTTLVVSGLFSIIIAASGAILTNLLNNYFIHNEVQMWIIILFLIGLLPQVYTRLISASLAGYGKVWQSNLGNEGLSVFILGTLLGTLILIKAEVSVIEIAAIYVLSRIITTLLLAVYFKKLLNYSGSVTFNFNAIFKSSKQFYVSNLLSVISNNIDVLILGVVVSPFKLGVYIIATRVALLNSFLLSAINSAFSPKMASLYRKKEFIELKTIYSKVNKILLFTGIGSLFFLIILGKFVLQLWGEDFVSGYLFLIIVSVGQFVNISTGSVGEVLNMTGLEKEHKKINLFWIIMKLLLSLSLIKIYGVLGAAIGFSIVLIGSNLTKLYVVRTRRKMLY